SGLFHVRRRASYRVAKRSKSGSQATQADFPDVTWPWPPFWRELANACVRERISLPRVLYETAMENRLSREKNRPKGRQLKRRRLTARAESLFVKPTSTTGTKQACSGGHPASLIGVAAKRDRGIIELRRVRRAVERFCINRVAASCRQSGNLVRAVKLHRPRRSATPSPDRCADYRPRRIVYSHDVRAENSSHIRPISRKGEGGSKE